MLLEVRSMCLGIPGKIIEIHDEGGLPMGVVDFGGVRRSVCLAYVSHDVGLGDYVIVHVGFAISKVDEIEAQRTFEVLREMSKHDELDWMAELGGMPSSVPTTAAAGDAAS
jgi:hydrogenase expression/formation protein HypC